MHPSLVRGLVGLRGEQQVALTGVEVAVEQLFALGVVDGDRAAPAVEAGLGCAFEDAALEVGDLRGSPPLLGAPVVEIAGQDR